MVTEYVREDIPTTAASSNLPLMILAVVLGSLLVIGIIAALVYMLFGGDQNTKSSALNSRFGKIISNLVLNVSVDEPSHSDLDADKFAKAKVSKTPKHKHCGHPIKTDRSSVPKWTMVKKTQSHSLGDQSHSAAKTRRSKGNRRHNTSGAHTTVRSTD
ncbi:hypothetical protein TYRP_014224 [Tyrophagus putrescentiae]|nr:hypothetical protein TYRP_014224 [Tyrophagus putrescentiae]